MERIREDSDGMSSVSSCYLDKHEDRRDDGDLLQLGYHDFIFTFH